jgi:hypothetical protein
LLCDGVTIGGVAFLAGLQQAADQYSKFGQGAHGYAKSVGAVYRNVFASTFLSGAVFPSLLSRILLIFIAAREYEETLTLRDR